MVNNLNIFKVLVLLIFGINYIFCQSAEEIIKITQEKSFKLTDSYYKFRIESKVDDPILPITGELYTSSNSKKYIIKAISENDGIIYFISINSSNYSIEKIEMKDSSTEQIINTFLTLTYDYNLSVPLSLFKFDIENYKNYTIVK